MSTPQHLRPETVFGYEHQLLTPEELTAVFEHIAQCGACRLALAGRMNVDDMAAAAQSLLASPPQSPVRLSRYAAVAALIVVSAAAFWYSRFRPVRSPEPPAVEEALLAGHIALPPFLRELQTERQVLMGGPGVAVPQIFSPRGTAVAALPVEFRWQPLDGEWTYQVRVFTLAGDPVTASPNIHTPQWSCPQLDAGSGYQWQVTAVRGTERVTLPQPPETPPRFRVLDSASAQRLRELARRQPSDHLRLGVEYARAGLLDDARAQLSEASRLAPGRPEILRLLQNLTPAK